MLPGKSDAGDVRLVTPGSCVLPGVSAGLPKAFSNGFGSFDRWVWLCAGLKYSWSPFCDGFGGGARGALTAGAAVSLLPVDAGSSSGCLMVGTESGCQLVSMLYHGQYCACLSGLGIEWVERWVKVRQTHSGIGGARGVNRIAACGGEKATQCAGEG